MNEPTSREEEAWIAAERRKTLDFLAHEKCRHGGISEWPAFHVFPDLALWAVQSIRHSGRIGWWAISGDVPTDYMSSEQGDHPRDALRHFSALWADVADHLRRGKPHPTIEFGTPDQWPELAEGLQIRADALAAYADDEGWED